MMSSPAIAPRNEQSVSGQRYRVFFLVNGRIVAAQNVDGANDNDAISAAMSLGHDEFELWQRGRYVARMPMRSLLTSYS